MGRVLRTYQLIAHSATVHPAIEIACSVEVQAGVLTLEYMVEGAVGHLSLPTAQAPARRDKLWQRTCFEAFLKQQGATGYAEFNFSPSGEWAAYQFDGYREGMAPHDVEGLSIATSKTDNGGRGQLKLSATVALAQNLRFPLRIGLSAVIEETDGTKSYWALNHPPGQPDFHHPDCFALTLEAPQRT